MIRSQPVDAVTVETAILQASEIIMYPENYRYTKEHEWVHVEGDIGTIGITDHAQHEFGDIVYVDLPKVGHACRAGQDRSARWNPSKPSPTSIRPVSRRSHGNQRRSGRHAGKAQCRSAWRGWLVKIKLTAPAEIERSPFRRRLQAYIGAGKCSCAIFRSPIPSAARCSTHAASKSPKICSPTCPKPFV